MKFKQNRYDPCVYNKITKDGSVTIRVHVDDSKISSRSQKQLKATIDHLRQIYGEITVHWGPDYDYLGMILMNHPEKNKVALSMRGYVEGCIEEFEQENPNQALKIVMTPATDNLFQVRSGEDTNVFVKTEGNAISFTCCEAFVFS